MFVSCSLIETWDLKICVFFILCCYGDIKLNSMVFVALIRLHGLGIEQVFLQRVFLSSELKRFYGGWSEASSVNLFRYSASALLNIRNE